MPRGKICYKYRFLPFVPIIFIVMFKGAIFLAGMLGLSQADRRLLENYSNSDQYQQYQIIPSGFFPSSTYQSNAWGLQNSYDPYIPVSPQPSAYQPESSQVVVRDPVPTFDYGQQQPIQQSWQPDNQIIPNYNLRVVDDRTYQRQPPVHNQAPLPDRAAKEEDKYTSIDYKYGSSTGSQSPYQNSKDCPYPRSYIGGICRCPNDGIFVANRCIARDPTPPSNCLPPRALIDGDCICPNNRIYTSGNSCVPAGTENTQSKQDCRLPRIYTVNGFCLCPNNGVYSGGQCLASSPWGSASQPTYNFYDYDGLSSLGRFFRSYDGTDNNRNNPRWGSKGSVLQRRSRPFYSDNVGQPVKHLPNPRHISNELADIGLSNIERSRNHVTSATTFFGQFLDHDLDLTEGGQKQRMDIAIPYADKFFKNSDKMPFVRSGYVMDRSRMHRNMITSWIDASQIYGSDEESCKSLRSFVNGKLKTSVDNMLPRDQKSGFFQAGDVRANENVMLSSYHTVFMREHNRACDQIKQVRPEMNDEAIFRSARQWVVGLFQKIVLEEFVPILMGDHYEKIVGKYDGYKPHVNPNIPTEFATAAFRVGHSLLIDQFSFINKNGVAYQNTRLSDLFLNPKYINSQTIEDAFRGLSRTLSKEKSIKISDQVRNLLILDPSQRQTKLDLFSLNLQRGRDHGLPSYNDARAAYGLKKVTRFDEIEPDFARAEKLKKVYNNRIDDVELFVGIISEQPVNNGILGQLGCQIVGQAFRNLRDGDRFWFEGAYPANVVQRIKETTLSDIIRRNTNLGRDIQDDIWHFYE